MHYLVKKFGWSVFKRPAKEVELLSLIEDVYDTYQKFLYEKQEREMR